MGDRFEFGARIERGIVKETTAEGIVVQSCERPDVISPPIRSIDGGLYRERDKVWFILFRDGDGAVLGLRS